MRGGAPTSSPAARLVAVLVVLAAARSPLLANTTISTPPTLSTIDAVEQQLEHALHVEQNAVLQDQSRITGDKDKIKAVENEEAQSQTQLDERVGCWNVKALGGTKTPLTKAQCRRSRANVGDTSRLRRVMRKLGRGECVVVVALGGSVTEGFPDGPKVRKAGNERGVVHMQWLQWGGLFHPSSPSPRPHSNSHPYPYGTRVCTARAHFTHPSLHHATLKLTLYSGMYSSTCTIMRPLSLHPFSLLVAAPPLPPTPDRIPAPTRAHSQRQVPILHGWPPR